jgi:predicted TIM-barrel fold metal-dependent hydrolase
LRLFDCDIACGRGTTALPRELEVPDDVIAEMDHSGIDEALVWHRDAFERAFEAGNARIGELDPYPRLHPVMTVVPACSDEMPAPEECIRRLRADDVRVVRVFPVQHHFLLNPLAVGDLFDLFVAYAIPVMAGLGQIPGGYDGVYRLMRDFPALRFILTATGCWGEDRFFRPLLKTYPGFHITTNRMETAGQIEGLVNCLGHEQILFGSGLPWNYAGGPILMIARAGLSDEAREAIAHGNIERLLAEVRW